MTKHSCLVLLLFSIAGCGPRIPDDFTVSGKTLDEWLEAQADSRPEVPAQAVWALGNVGPEIPDVVPAMIKALGDPDAGIRGQAVLALLKFGPAAKDAIPALTEAQNDEEASVRELATKALERIEGR